MAAFLDAEKDGNAGASYRDAMAERKAETRRRILASARAVFLRSGYAEANLNEIASGAEVGKGTLYRHFDSKSELYVAMLSEHGDALVRDMVDAIDGEGPVLKQIAQMARFYLEFWKRHPDHFQIIRAVQGADWIGPISPELMGHLRHVFERPLRVLEALIRRGIDRGEIRPVDPWNAANALSLSANAVIGPIVSGGLPVVDRDFEAVYGQLQDLLIAGLAAPDGDGD
ncbi:MAG TPA: TetR/AcrR family transcriptional regulator [Myxococcota bacterium]|nr:TetR/AcrR family transcriptional regulator [Myxococcota bacterium]